MGAVPKRRTSTRRKGKRRAGKVLNQKNVKACKQCGEPILPHTACKHCGTYK